MKINLSVVSYNFSKDLGLLKKYLKNHTYDKLNIFEKNNLAFI